MSHWQQQYLPPATTTPHDYIDFRTTVALTAVEIENKKKVAKLDANDNAMKGSVWLYAPGNDEDGATVTSKYSKEKINVIVDGNNKEEDDVVDTFDDSNSKDVMFVYAFNTDKDISGEDQDTVMCYEDHAQKEDVTDYNNAFYNSTNPDQQQQLLGLSPSCCTSLGPPLGTSLRLSPPCCTSLGPPLGTLLCSLLGKSLGICTLLALFSARGGTYPKHCASSNAPKLNLSYGLILVTNLGHELDQSQSDVELEFGQSDED